MEHVFTIIAIIGAGLLGWIILNAIFLLVKYIQLWRMYR